MDNARVDAILKAKLAEKGMTLDKGTCSSDGFDYTTMW